MLKDYQKRILELLEQLELELAGLYELFSGKYPGRKDLWDTLVQEEREHADQAKKLHLLADEGKASFDEKMTKTYTVQLFIDNVKKVYAETEANKISLLKALTLSNDFEQSIIEKKLYDYFISGDPDVKAIIKHIQEDTNDHLSRIKKAIKEEKTGDGSSLKEV